MYGLLNVHVEKCIHVHDPVIKRVHILYMRSDQPQWVMVNLTQHHVHVRYGINDLNWNLKPVTNSSESFSSKILKLTVL